VGADNQATSQRKRKHFVIACGGHCLSGNNWVTMASGMNIFTRDMLGNGVINFLNRISVLSEIVFPDINLDDFPKLRVVIRSDLEAPKRPRYSGAYPRLHLSA